MSTWKSAKIEESVYARLEAVKGSYSISSYIDLMLNYFTVTATDPKAAQAHPTILALKELERIIKIIKAVEKDKLNPILAIVKEMREYGIKKESSGSESIDISVEEVTAVVNANEQLTKELDKQKKLNSELNNKIAILEANKPSIAGLSESSVTELKELLEWLKDNTKSSNFTSDLIINKSTFATFVTRFQDALKL